jgi:hypothetical protein
MTGTPVLSEAKGIMLILASYINPAIAAILQVFEGTVF